MNVGDNANIGEVQATAAGRDIYHGMTPDQLRQTLRDQSEFFTALVTGYERLYKDVHRNLDRVEDAVRLWQALFEQRQEADDQADKERVATEEHQRQIARKRLRRIEFMVIAIAVVLVGIVVVLIVMIARLWPSLALALLT